eukprot:TRINITY_DN6714_c0_g4_i1.p1 TRINITY_DN6714_c0_g4~~TRINITY_DN6714_c0_g4_i1.p1  ORF type:complete len:541 (+),score=91.18 TRINITY_DN6714_c0_g4_i1:551-2173(+)
MLPTLLVASLVAQFQVDDDKVVVQIQGGRIKGKYDAQRGLAKWLGVPYGKPPIGDLRWAPPVPREGWDGVMDTLLFPPDCPQKPDFSSFFPGEQSEDCLYLNVWAPIQEMSTTTPPLRPVFVFIHGGSFTAGSGSGNDWPTNPLYQGSTIGTADLTGAVLVTFNYRIGVFGFLGGKRVAKSTPDGSSGNFGIQDQLLVLKWVKLNAGHFGGDPEKVTVFGESSGASCVGALLVMNSSRGLFHNAGLESGSYDNATIQVNPDAVYRSVLEGARCDDLSCLRSLSFHDIMKASWEATSGGLWGPVVDGVVLHNTPERLAAAGHFNKEIRSVLLGTNKNEGRLLINERWPYIRTLKQYEEWITECGFFPASKLQNILSLYPCMGGDLGCWKAASEVWTDSQFTCPARRTARNIIKSKHGAKVFLYFLELAPPSYSTFLAVSSGVDPKLVGVSPHGGELPLVFNDTSWVKTPQGKRLATEFVTYYHGLAEYSDVNARTQNLTFWPPYSLQNDTSLSLGFTTQPQQHLRQRYCDFWDTVVLPTAP